LLVLCSPDEATPSILKEKSRVNHNIDSDSDCCQLLDSQGSEAQTVRLRKSSQKKTEATSKYEESVQRANSFLNNLKFQ